jgi:hypothetical protein
MCTPDSGEVSISWTSGLQELEILDCCRCTFADAGQDQTQTCRLCIGGKPVAGQFLKIPNRDQSPWCRRKWSSAMKQFFW